MIETTNSRSRIPSSAEARVRQVELVISNLLRVSVLVSVIVIVIGTAASFFEHPEFRSSPAALQQLTDPGGVSLHSVGAVTAGLRERRGAAIVMLGLLLLIATPVARVGISIFAFIYERDRVYTLITLTVFCLLILSFILGKVG